MTKKTTKKTKKVTEANKKAEKKTQARRDGLKLLSNITMDLYNFKDMVRKGEVCGVGCGDVEDAIAFIGKISNRVCMYSW